MVLHNRRLLLVVMLVVLLVGIAGLPVYAQDGPKHTGPPDGIDREKSDEPYDWAVVGCDGYDVQITVLREDNFWQFWLTEEFSIDPPYLFVIGHHNEDVRFTNLATGRSVDVRLRYHAEWDTTAATTTITGIRSAVVGPGGQEEKVRNIGRLLMAYTPNSNSGSVISVAGHWDAVKDGVYRQLDFVCQAFAD